MLINNDIKAVHINNLEAQMSPYSVKDPMAIEQIVDIINRASKKPAKFKAKLEIEFDSIDDKIFVNGQYFKYQGITYHTDLDFEMWLNKLIYDLQNL